MDIMNMAADMLADKLGVESDTISGVMERLIGNGDNFDLGSLVSNFQSNGLSDIAASWLGDGENASISIDQLKGVLGGEKVAEAAAELGTDEGSLLESLTSALPQIVDKSSEGGSLLDSIGGLDGLAGMAKKFL